MIEKLEMTIYENDGWTHTSREFFGPSWKVVLNKLKTMHNFNRPYLWLLKSKDVSDANLLVVCGGGGIFHIQVEEGGDWYEAVDPHGSNEEISVWLSDQGFATEKRKTWVLEDAIEIVRYYFDTGNMNPKYNWTNE